jgi:hypothetical protein
VVLPRSSTSSYVAEIDQKSQNTGYPGMSKMQGTKLLKFYQTFEQTFRLKKFIFFCCMVNSETDGFHHGTCTKKKKKGKKKKREI